MSKFILQMSGGVGVPPTNTEIRANDTSEALSRAIENSKEMASNHYYRFVLFGPGDKPTHQWSIKKIPTVQFLQDC